MRICGLFNGVRINGEFWSREMDLPKSEMLLACCMLLLGLGLTERGIVFGSGL